MQYSKQKCNIPFWIRVYNFPFGQCSVFLQGQYPYNIWSIPWKVTPCPLKECSVHFHMSKLPFKGAVVLLEKSISFCTIYIYTYIYIYVYIYIQYYWHVEHPFQECTIYLSLSLCLPLVRSGQPPWSETSLT